MKTKIIAIAVLATSMTAAFAQSGLASLDNQPGNVPENDILTARMNTLYGPTGLITIPTAHTTGYSRMVLGYHFGYEKSVSLNYGIWPSIEVGGSFFDRTTGRDKALANAKVTIIPANFQNIQIGIGVIDAIDAIDRTVYGVATWEQVVPDALENQFVGLRLHAGFGNGIYREQFIGGAEFLVNRKISVIGEYNGKNMNAGLRYVRNEGLRMQAGVQDKHIFVSSSFAFNF